MNVRPSIISIVALVPGAHAATINISFHAYDQSAQSTPYYSHYGVTSDLGVPGWYGAGDGVPEVVSIVNLMNSGWGFRETGTSSYHVMSKVETTPNYPRPLRTIGWHEFSFVFDTVSQGMSIRMNGTEIQNGTYSNPITWFMFAYNGGSGRETVIDDFTVTYNGREVYQQGFNSSSLDSAWVVTRTDSGGYVTSGDTSNPYSGVGSLALGGNVSGVAFDLTCVPEPTSLALALAGVTIVASRRRRL